MRTADHAAADPDCLGVDIVFNRPLGPLMLELNAGPGLSTQIANRCDLIGGLQRLQVTRTIPSAERAALARDCFESGDGPS